VRDRLFDAIHEVAVAVGVGVVGERTIEETDIRRASARAMELSVRALSVRPDFVIVDAMELDLDIPHLPLVRADALCACVSAASVVAKVTRDRIMEEYDRLYPGYGFSVHKGYPTARHVEALRRLGPTPIHRRTYAPVAELLR
jgi:ribonuclease HII